MEKKIMVVPPKMTGIEKTKAKEIKALFQPMLDTMEKYEEDYNRIMALEDSPEKAKEARKLRLLYVKVRTGTAKIHKGAKAYHLAAGNAIDGFKNAQLFAGGEIEKELEKVEKYEELAKAASVEEVRKARGFELAEFGIPVVAHPPNMGEWTEEVWQPYLDGIKARYREKKEEDLQAKKKEAEVIAEKEAEEKAKDIEIKRLKAQIENAQNIGQDTVQVSHDVIVDLNTGEIVEGRINKISPITDQEQALRLILDLNNLGNKYTFENDQYIFAYEKMKERFDGMEKYLRTLNKTHND